MTTGKRPGLATPQRVAAIVAGTAAMAAVILFVGRSIDGIEEPEFPAVRQPSASGVVPIAEEADVFLRARGERVVPWEADRRDGAQPRTLVIHRALRAYPGAPPQIPHGLTDREFRTSRCNTCHERGGFSPRFAAYAPVTPHPGFTDCLQCHAASTNRVGVGFPERAAGPVCLQCHTADVVASPAPIIDWPAPDWPRLGGRAMDGTPPWIPHRLELRGDCLACHAGPAALEEIRTSHPERANCRQCHVPAPDDGAVFVRESPTDLEHGQEGGRR